MKDGDCEALAGVEGLWDGKGRFGRRPSSIEGTSESITSAERMGKGEKRRGWVRVWRARVWWVRCDAMEVCAVINLGRVSIRVKSVYYE